MSDELLHNDLTPIGVYNFRNQRKKFGIKVNDRRRHVYIVGKTGTGKTTLMRNMMIADIKAGRGVAVLDPHGEFAESLLDYIPEERINDVIYFDPSDLEHPIAFNPMEQVGTEFRHLVASGIMSVFKKIWVDAWSARMEYILNNTLLSLLEFPGSTLLGVMRMFSDKEYRKKIVSNLSDPVIKAFWEDEFANYGQRLEAEALASIQNKVGQLVSNPLIRNIMGQARSALNMREIMDSGKILLVNLSKGKIGEDNSALLGAMIITRFQLAAMSRIDIPEEKRRDFFLYVDEFQNFATDSFANILSEARKYGLSLALAHQYIGQLEEGATTRVRDAIFGNVGTIITFRVGATDAEFLEKEFMPQFLQTDLVNLGFGSVYVRLMIDGMASQPFSAETLPPQPAPLTSYRDIIIKNSRDHYGTSRSVVEKKIGDDWHAESGNMITEKIARRDERGLSETLRTGAPVQTRSPRFVAPPPSPSSSRPLTTPAPFLRSVQPTSGAGTTFTPRPMPSSPVVPRRSDVPSSKIHSSGVSPAVSVTPPPIYKPVDSMTSPVSVLPSTEKIDPTIPKRVVSSPAPTPLRSTPSVVSEAPSKPAFAPIREVTADDQDDPMVQQFLKSREKIVEEKKEKEKKQFVRPQIDIEKLRASIAGKMNNGGQMNVASVEKKHITPVLKDAPAALDSSDDILSGDGDAPASKRDIRELLPKEKNDGEVVSNKQ